MRNRREHLISDKKESGVLCDWQWTSDLHALKVFPGLGLCLMRRAFKDWPVIFRDELLSQNDAITISFVIGHRGTERLPHLLATIKSIASQRQVSVECIVVEQSACPEIEAQLPGWVRYIYTPLPYTDMPYCRSWAFNVGARIARGDVLVLHDNDMLVPQDYALEIMKRHAEGYEVMNLKRFIFYLSRSYSERIFSSTAIVLDEAPETVVQNLEAGGSVAISRKAYFEIGGFDESFIGWGGEDNEFWDRAQTLEVWPYGYMPLVHLWHTPQAEKSVADRPTVSMMDLRLAISASQRILELSERDFGGTRQTNPPYSPLCNGQERNNVHT